MVQARTAGRPGRTAAPSRPSTRRANTDRLRERIAELLLQAVDLRPLRGQVAAQGFNLRGDGGLAALFYADVMLRFGCRCICGGDLGVRCMRLACNSRSQYQTGKRVQVHLHGASQK